MKIHAAIAIALLLCGTTAEPTCADDGATTPASRYAHADASLTLASADAGLPSSDVRVQIRGRPMLTYSHRPELPDYIFGPSSSSFPLVAYAGVANTSGTHAADNATAAPSIADYAMAANALLTENLLSHGAVLIRGLPLADGFDYSQFVDALGWNAKKLGGGGTQRKDITSKVRTASEEPASQTIEPHLDMAHSIAHPKRIGFFCAAGPPPGMGGETVLTDMRGVYADMAKGGVVDEFEQRGGVAYHKRLWDAERVNHSYTWQNFFFASDVETALGEVRKRDPDARLGEHGPGVIDYRETLPAVVPHPHTGEPTWFNGVHTNHESYYVEAAHVDTSDGSPMHTTYADGTTIAPETVAAVRAAFWRNSAAVRCQTGDVVVVDNMLAGHGRMSWDPSVERKMLVTHFLD